MPLRLGGREFGDHELLVMAVINRTPDSFFDRGATFGLDAALAAVERAIADGADIVDIGGVKAGRGEPVTAAEEIERVAGLVAMVRRRHPRVVISVDTWRSEVAEAVIDAGANLINDSWGGADQRLVAVAAAGGAGVVCSHSGTLPPRTDPHRPHYDDVVADVAAHVTALARRAVAHGVDPASILIDPTHDFGKNTWHSLELTRRLPELVATGWPVLVAISHKDFIGETLDLPVERRQDGTTATLAVSAWLGGRVFRVHHPRSARQALDMVSAIRGDRPPAAPRRGLA